MGKKKPSTVQEPCLELKNNKGINYRKLYFSVQIIKESLIFKKPLQSSLTFFVHILHGSVVKHKYYFES